MIRAVLLVATLAVGATAVVAQSDPIKARQSAMKAVGDAMKAPAAFMKGEQPFNLDAAKASFKTMNDVAKTFGTHFPDSSKTGGDTAADPKIWTDAAGFKTALAAFEKASGDALMNVKDEASFKAEFPKVGKTCGDCHNTFRVKK